MSWSLCSLCSNVQEDPGYGILVLWTPVGLRSMYYNLCLLIKWSECKRRTVAERSSHVSHHQSDLD